jgi:hypothetical protein
MTFRILILDPFAHNKLLAVYWIPTLLCWLDLRERYPNMLFKEAPERYPRETPCVSS